MTVHEFHKSSVLGRKGEAIVKALFEAGGVRYEDVSGQKSWQDEDVDFLCHGWRWDTVEVKADRYRDNFFIETVSNMEEAVPGWLWKTTADVIAYCFVELGVTYWLPRQRLQQLARFENWDQYGKRVANSDSWRKDRPKGWARQSYGYAIPRQVLISELNQIASAGGRVMMSKNPVVAPAPELHFAPLSGARPDGILVRAA